MRAHITPFSTPLGGGRGRNIGHRHWRLGRSAPLPPKGGGEGWQCPSFAPSNSLSCRSLHFSLFRFIVFCVSFILMFRCISVYILHHSCDLPHTLRCDGELPSGANKDKVKIVTIGVIIIVTIGVINKNIVGNLILLTSISSMILQQCHY